MAPYGGPPLLEIVKLLKKGELPYALGFGLPRATFQRDADGVLELRGLSGGEGFGVQADLVSPFADAGPLVRGSWQQIVAWLCEHWDYGDPWGTSKERLEIRFADQVITALTLDEAASACRAARAAGAEVEFDVVRVKVAYDLVVEDCGGNGAALSEKMKERVGVSHAAGLALQRNEPGKIYSTDREDYAKHAYDVASKVDGVRVKLVVRRA